MGDVLLDTEGRSRSWMYSGETYGRSTEKMYSYS
jgi:hypothetical protein